MGFLAKLSVPLRMSCARPAQNLQRSSVNTVTLKLPPRSETAVLSKVRFLSDVDQPDIANREVWTKEKPKDKTSGFVQEKGLEPSL